MLERWEAEEFLFQEAQLLDERRFDDWLDLFTPTGIYWLPIDDQAEPDQATSLIYDEPLRRRERVWRLLHTPVQGQMPPSRTCHSITNVRVEPNRGAARVLSSQIIHEMQPSSLDSSAREQQPRAFVGRGEHHLERQDGRILIAMKKLILLNRDAPMKNLTFLL